jgi:hypothetical protein
LLQSGEGGFGPGMVFLRKRVGVNLEKVVDFIWGVGMLYERTDESSLREVEFSRALRKVVGIFKLKCF